jgi:hypothetical protein
MKFYAIIDEFCEKKILTKELINDNPVLFLREKKWFPN